MQNARIKLELPYPPSVNHYWKRARGKVFLSQAARDYRDEVCVTWLQYRQLFHVRGFGNRKVELAIRIYPPDNRRRDIDNILKAVFDGLEVAGVIKDDSQVKRLSVESCEPCDGGCVVVEVAAWKARSNSDK
ncbi:MAG TPA: RusA family crossover junction endodeoxyribonuclease [Bacillota bacterium]|nr:RusA family crossover junction endodeoxyribonuclease [Bacillota bacterium]HPZ14600.1 RusA family crossover junction endodeoxyribonuclease [Bacillota bacterium]